jgi:hypothetical protein
MTKQKKDDPPNYVRMWVGTVPESLRKEADKLRTFKGYNKQVALIKMLELFINHVNNE